VKEMAELTLKQRILNEIDNRPRGYTEELAVISGYSSGSALKKVLKDEKKEFEKFSAVVNIVNELFKGQIAKIMKEYATTLDVKKQTARYMLEYCEISTFHELKEELINKMLNCGNAYSEEWAEIYQIEMLYQQKKIKLGEAVTRFSAINPKQPETRVAIEIYKSYCYLVEKQYEMIYHSLLTVGTHIEEIKEPYIKNMYHGRYTLLMVEYYTRKDELATARELCEGILNHNTLDLYKCHAYMHLGNTYIVESFEKGYEYLSKGIEISHNRLRGIDKHLKRSMNFLCNVWNVDPKYLNLQSKEGSDIHEIAFYYINKGQKTEAEKSLNKVNMDEICSNSRGFHYYLRGLLTNNIDFHAESVTNFKVSGDYYFLKLPLLQLKQLGMPDSIIKALTM
jgi:hypothetical protein